MARVWLLLAAAACAASAAAAPRRLFDRVSPVLWLTDSSHAPALAADSGLTVTLVVGVSPRAREGVEGRGETHLPRAAC